MAEEGEDWLWHKEGGSWGAGGRKGLAALEGLLMGGRGGGGVRHVLVTEGAARGRVCLQLACRYDESFCNV